MPYLLWQTCTVFATMIWIWIFKISKESGRSRSLYSISLRDILFHFRQVSSKWNTFSRLDKFNSDFELWSAVASSEARIVLCNVRAIPQNMKHTLLVWLSRMWLTQCIWRLRMHKDMKTAMQEVLKPCVLKSSIKKNRCSHYWFAKKRVWRTLIRSQRLKNTIEG